jgi:hypothetical protein
LRETLAHLRHRFVEKLFQNLRKMRDHGQHACFTDGTKPAAFLWLSGSIVVAASSYAWSQTTF